MKQGPIPPVIVSLIAVAASGCTAGIDPIRIHETPLWTSSDIVPSSEVEGVDMRGDSVVFDAGGRMVTVDTESGEIIWSLDIGQQLFGGDGEVAHKWNYARFSAPNGELVTTGTAQEWSVIVPYRVPAEGEPNDDEQAAGIAALSGEDGSLVWKKELGTLEDEFDTQWPVLPVLSTVDTVLLGPPEHSSDGEGSPIMAVDAANGEELWEQRIAGQPAQQTGDGTFFTMATADDFNVGEAPYMGSDVVAWDLRSGQRLWEIPEEHDDIWWGGVVDDTLVLSVEEFGRLDEVYISVDIESGEQLEQLGEGQGDCVTDNQHTLACHGLDGLMTFDAQSGDGQVADLDAEDDWDTKIVGVHHGQVFISGPTGIQVHDSHGKVIARDVPGRPVEITEEYALFLTSDDNSIVGVELYEVTS